MAVMISATTHVSKLQAKAKPGSEKQSDHDEERGA